MLLKYTIDFLLMIFDFGRLYYRAKEFLNQKFWGILYFLLLTLAWRTVSHPEYESRAH